MQYARSFVTVLLTLLLCTRVEAGYCEPENNTERVEFAFNKTLGSTEGNVGGSVLADAHSWNTGGHYNVNCDCLAPGQEYRSNVFFSTKTTLNKGVSRTINGAVIQFYEINRNLQVGTEIYLGEGVQAFRATPWEGVDNLTTTSSRCPVVGGAIDATVRVPLTTARRGRLHLFINSPFTGSVSVPEFKVLDLYGNMTSPKPMSVRPIMSLFMSVNVVVPPRCQLAAGQQTSIDFGALSPAQLASPGAGRQGVVKRNFQIQCSNVSAKVKVSLALEGRPYGQDARYLKTSHGGIAIAMESGGKLVPPSRPGSTPASNQLIPIALDYPSLKARFDLLAWPVKMQPRPEPGAFQGNATLLFDFE